MRQRAFNWLFAITGTLLTPVLALGQEAPTIDARLDGYAQGANWNLKEASGSGLTWLLLIALAAVCVGVMFINSKRSHLD